MLLAEKNGELYSSCLIFSLFKKLGYIYFRAECVGSFLFPGKTVRNRVILLKFRKFGKVFIF
ncbi:hypothetical protein HMPREF0322_02537 [Desulfitobacterium hafniense DP7]|uniref:Uncharacterized protein n=1 Tax=Desulfitobacterium hafniense DP7 TaxID=537010 RepID=G9XNJ5_DESHA|nr:hypothetical protein HMPREF0322_02537 [Desulfitobacterium hafniense DP7]